MRKLWMLVVIVGALCLAPIVQADDSLSDGVYTIDYLIKKADDESVSMANDYFEKPATVTVDQGEIKVQIQLNHSAWITEVKVPEAGDYVDAEVVSSNSEADTRVIRFSVPNLSDPVITKIHVTVADIDYDHDYTIRFVFDPDTLQTVKTTQPDQAVQELQEEAETASGQSEQTDGEKESSSVPSEHSVQQTDEHTQSMSNLNKDSELEDSAQDDESEETATVSTSQNENKESASEMEDEPSSSQSASTLVDDVDSSSISNAEGSDSKDKAKTDKSAGEVQAADHELENESSDKENPMSDSEISKSEATTSMEQSSASTEGDDSDANVSLSETEQALVDSNEELDQPIEQSENRLHWIGILVALVVIATGVATFVQLNKNKKKNTTV